MEHFKIELSYKELEKDGGAIHFDYLNIWANSLDKAQNLAKRIWFKNFGQSDLTFINSK